MNAHVYGTETPTPAIVTQIDIAWLQSSGGTPSENEATAVAAGRGVTLTSAQDCANFMNATCRSTAPSQAYYALSSANMVSGQQYVPAVRVTDSAYGAGSWHRGTAFTPTVLPYSEVFTATNGTVPSGFTYRNSSGTLATNSTWDIQSNKLQIYQASTTSGVWAIKSMLTTQQFPFAAGRTVTAILEAVAPNTVSTNNEACSLLITSPNTVFRESDSYPLNDYIQASINYVAVSGYFLDINVMQSDGNYVNAAHTLLGSNSANLSLSFPTTTTLTVTCNGSSILNNYSLPVLLDWSGYFRVGGLLMTQFTAYCTYTFDTLTIS